MQNQTSPQAPSRLATVKTERAKARAASVAAHLAARDEKRRAERWARAFPDGAPPRPLFVSQAERRSARAMLQGRAPSVPVSGGTLQLEADIQRRQREKRAEKRRLAALETNRLKRARADKLEDVKHEARLAKQKKRFEEQEENRRRALLDLEPAAMRKAAETLRLIETGVLPGLVPKGTTSAELLQLADVRDGKVTID